MQIIKTYSLLIEAIKNQSNRLATVQRLREINPSALISIEARVSGEIEKIHLGNKTVVESGSEISNNQGSITVGNNCKIKSGSKILSYGGGINIGNECSVNPYTIIYGHGGISIGDFVRIAAHCIIIPANHNFDDINIPIYKQGLTLRGIIIGDDVWIGANVTVLDGVTIGNGTIIGANSIVVDNIPPYSIAVGNPARVIKTRK